MHALHERIFDLLAHQSPMKSFGVFTALFWQIYASEVKFRSGHLSRVQLGPLQPKCFGVDLQNVTS